MYLHGKEKKVTVTISYMEVLLQNMRQLQATVTDHEEGTLYRTLSTDMIARIKTGNFSLLTTFSTKNPT